jgi:hypothetical protein
VANQNSTITVDRISSTGNATADQRVQDKVVHASIKKLGATLEVKLIDQGSHFEAKPTDRATETQPRQTSTSSTGDLAKDRSITDSDDRYSFSVGKSVSRESTGKEMCSLASSRKQ